MLENRTVVLGVGEEGGNSTAPNTETTFGQAPPGGRLISEQTVTVTGCVLDETLQRFTDGSVFDVKTDLSYLDTAPDSVRLAPPSTNADYASLGATVSFQYLPDISERLMRVSDEASDLMDQAMSEFPRDIPARLRWLRDNYQSKLTDKIYLGAARITTGDGVTIVSPPYNFLWRTFYVAPQNAHKLADAIIKFAKTYCPGA